VGDSLSEVLQRGSEEAVGQTVFHAGGLRAAFLFWCLENNWRSSGCSGWHNQDRGCSRPSRPNLRRSARLARCSLQQDRRSKDRRSKDRRSKDQRSKIKDRGSKIEDQTSRIKDRRISKTGRASGDGYGVHEKIRAGGMFSGWNPCSTERKHVRRNGNMTPEYW
jgi:hypothetical protein